MVSAIVAGFFKDSNNKWRVVGFATPPSKAGIDEYGQKFLKNLFSDENSMRDSFVKAHEKILIRNQGSNGYLYKTWVIVFDPSVDTPKNLANYKEAGIRWLDKNCDMKQSQSPNPIVANVRSAFIDFCKHEKLNVTKQILLKESITTFTMPDITLQTVENEDDHDNNNYGDEDEEAMNSYQRKQQQQVRKYDRQRFALSDDEGDNGEDSEDDQQQQQSDFRLAQRRAKRKSNHDDDLLLEEFGPDLKRKLGYQDQQMRMSSSQIGQQQLREQRELMEQMRRNNAKKKIASEIVVQVDRIPGEPIMQTDIHDLRQNFTSSMSSSVSKLKDLSKRATEMTEKSMKSQAFSSGKGGGDGGGGSDVDEWTRYLNKYKAREKMKQEYKKMKQQQRMAMMNGNNNSDNQSESGSTISLQQQYSKNYRY